MSISDQGGLFEYLIKIEINSKNTQNTDDYVNDERVDFLGEELFTALHSPKDRLYILKQNELLTKFMKSEWV